MRRLSITFILIALAALCLLLAVFVFIPAQAERQYGPASPRLGLMERVQFSMRVLWDDGLLITPASASGSTQHFSVDIGESVPSIAARLEQVGLILEASAFRDYLIYTGLDTSIQAGTYELNSTMSIVEVARAMQDATPSEVTFVVLPGWRMEEIAASLPTSGLAATPEAFLQAARQPLALDFLAGATSNEGFLFPDSYILPRTTDATQLVDALVRNFGLHLTPELRQSISNQNLTILQAVTLASLVERESVKEYEMPLIASVFLNRLNAGWKLDSDPTVQYAIGSDGNWWPNPLSTADLGVASPFNTYANTGLPPAPISNPSLAALQAVANPMPTNYFFFRARCDGSGLHNFAETLDQHIANACP